MQGNSALFYMETQAFIRVVEILAAVVQSGLHAMEKALIKLNLFNVLLWKLKLIIFDYVKWFNSDNWRNFSELGWQKWRILNSAGSYNLIEPVT